MQQLLFAMPVVWLFYFSAGALGVLCDVRNYRQSIRALVAGAISGGTAGLTWAALSLFLSITGPLPPESTLPEAIYGLSGFALLAIAGAWAQTIVAVIFGAAGVWPA